MGSKSYVFIEWDTVPKEINFNGPVDDLPICVYDSNGTSVQPRTATTAFVEKEFNLSRLNAMVSHGLWLAGRLGNIRCLHRQQLLGRRITICEQLDLHLLWHDDAIYIKPLCSWILSIVVSDNIEVAAALNEYLASYARLVQYKSDFKMAKAENIIPDDMNWEAWQKLVAIRLSPLVTDIAAGRAPCAARFQYGELRLSRVNSIYRFHPTYRCKHFFRGYHATNRTYRSFLRNNFAWLVVVFAYTTIILTAMQVGLGTSQLQANMSFSRASFGFTIFSIFLPVVALGAGLIFSLVLTYYHVGATRRHIQQTKGHAIAARQV